MLEAVGPRSGLALLVVGPVESGHCGGSIPAGRASRPSGRPRREPGRSRPGHRKMRARARPSRFNFANFEVGEPGSRRIRRNQARRTLHLQAETASNPGRRAPSTARASSSGLWLPMRSLEPSSEVEPDAPVAPGVEDPLAVAAVADAPAAVVGRSGGTGRPRPGRCVADRDGPAVGGDPAEPDADLGRGDHRRHPEHADHERGPGRPGRRRSRAEMVRPCGRHERAGRAAPAQQVDHQARRHHQAQQRRRSTSRTAAPRG